MAESRIKDQELKTASVWIIDDEELFSLMLSEAVRLSPLFPEVKCFSSAKVALSELTSEECLPDIVLLDIVMPDLNGLEAIQPIKQVSPGTRVIILTNYNTDENFRLGIGRGASGFLLKSSNLAQIHDVLSSALAGGMPIDSEVTPKLVALAGLDKRLERDHDVSFREREVLHYIAEGLTTKEIAEKLCLSHFTVDNHIKNLVTKLHARTRSHLVSVAFKENLI